MRRFLTLVVAALMAASACSEDGSSPAVLEVKVQRAAADPAKASELGQPLIAFAARLYGELARRGDNLAFSPSSIYTALAMARAGASGATAAEFDAALAAVDVHGSVNALDQNLRSRNRDGVETSAANALWGQEGMNVKRPFLETLATNYGAGLRTMDCKSNPEGARRAVNDWVEDETRGKIEDLIQPGIVDNLTRMIAVNAIYLNAKWLEPFKKEKTTPRPFHKLDGSTVDARMMRDDRRVPYGEGPGWKAIELPYMGEELGMLVVLPDAGGFAGVEGGALASTLSAATAALRPAMVDLGLPKFELTIPAALKEPLQALGIRQAFDPTVADFSAITDDEQLVLKDVVHKAYVRVDELGTEAAAATAAVAGATSAAPARMTFIADRPFIWAVRDRQTGALLFMGRILDPSG